MILDVSSRYKTSTPSNGEDDVVNFANTFQEEDLNVENLTFEEENKNNKIKDEDRIIKDEEQIKLRATIPNNLPFTIIISRRQGNKEADNNARKYNLKRLARKTK